jgi:hypothetical protein
MVPILFMFFIFMSIIHTINQHDVCVYVVTDIFQFRVFMNFYLKPHFDHLTAQYLTFSALPLRSFSIVSAYLLRDIVMAVNIHIVSFESD